MAVPAMAQNLTDLSTLCRAGGLRARQEIRCAFWRERRAGRCKAPRRRRCGGIVEEQQRRRCPPAAAPLRAAARRPAGCVARSLHTAAGMLVARALPAGLGASSKMYTLFPDGPLAVNAAHLAFTTKTRRREEFCATGRVLRTFSSALSPCGSGTRLRQRCARCSA